MYAFDSHGTFPIFALLSDFTSSVCPSYQHFYHQDPNKLYFSVVLPSWMVDWPYKSFVWVLTMISGHPFLNPHSVVGALWPIHPNGRGYHCARSEGEESKCISNGCKISLKCLILYQINHHWVNLVVIHLWACKRWYLLGLTRSADLVAVHVFRG